MPQNKTRPNFLDYLIVEAKVASLLFYLNHFAAWGKKVDTYFFEEYLR